MCRDCVQCYTVNALYRSHQKLRQPLPQLPRHQHKANRAAARHSYHCRSSSGAATLSLMLAGVTRCFVNYCYDVCSVSTRYNAARATTHNATFFNCTHCALLLSLQRACFESVMIQELQYVDQYTMYTPHTVQHCTTNVCTPHFHVICHSPLWDPAIRGYATATAKGTPDHVISEARHTAVTGRHWTALQPPASTSTSTSTSSSTDQQAAAQLQSYLCVPVLLIAASSSSTSSSSSSSKSNSSKRPARAATASDAAAAAFDVSAVQCGWDIIAPAGWAAALLKALVFAGARAIGQVSISII
jgi:hypothetical protein